MKLGRGSSTIALLKTLIWWDAMVTTMLDMRAARSRPTVESLGANNCVVRTLVKNSSTSSDVSFISPRIMGSVPPLVKYCSRLKKTSCSESGPVAVELVLLLRRENCDLTKE